MGGNLRGRRMGWIQSRDVRLHAMFRGVFAAAYGQGQRDQQSCV